jgi:uncharacterized protein YbjT (DUF2867 family)
MDTTLLVAGATGHLGRAVVARALARGARVRALVRDPARLPPALRERVEVVVGDARDRAAADQAVRGADRVFSCAGASVMPGPGRGWRGYGAVDWPANRTLIDAAAAAGARRFTYVSVHHPPAMRRIGYVAAHERVVDHLRRADLAWAVIRPTGFFSAVEAYLDLARRGRIPEIGASARARTNPIADDDLAAVCVDAALDDEPGLEVAAGGPDMVTRRTIGELAFAALGTAPRFRRIPAWLARGGAALLRPFHPRMAQVAAFITALGAHDIVAPPLGHLRLADHFANRARAPVAAGPVTV